MNSIYVEWLKEQGVPLFESGELSWRLYKGALLPAHAFPCFTQLNHEEAKGLIMKSGAYFLRYSSDPCKEDTEWWYIICDTFDPKKLSSKMRNQISRGNRMCTVEQIDVEWLAKYGYECYVAAFSRYRGASPTTAKQFQSSILATASGPFEYWGVFVNRRLAGYCQCIIEGKHVASSVIKYDPAFLRYYSSYALINGMIHHYIVKRGLSMNNGSRSIAHDTNMQDFLLKFGFRKHFCRLNVVYRPWLKHTVKTLFPLRSFFNTLSKSIPMNKIQTLLYQEGLRRACSVR